MKRQILALTALTATTTAIFVVASGSAQTSGRTLTLFQNTASESNSFVDNAPKSPSKSPESDRFRLSAGDELTARTPLLDRRGGKRLGTAYAHVAVVDGEKFDSAVLQGDVVVALRDGTIVISGLAGAADRPLAVVGGTGAYEGSRGSASEKETDDGAELTIRLLP